MARPAPAPADAFVRAAAQGLVRPGDSADAARAARAALEHVLQDQRSLVLEAQFTGFTHRGEAVGGLDAAVLRAAAQLIMLRVTRIGFTADADVDALETLFGVLSQPPGALAGGVIGALQAAGPRGVYVSTANDEVYKPATAASPADESSAAAPAIPSNEHEAETDFADFQLLDAPPEMEPLQHGSAVPPGKSAHGELQAAEGEDDALFHFFRTSSTSGNAGDAGDAGELIGSLQQADNLARYTELARTITRETVTRLDSGDPEEAVEMIRALAAETERHDRTRIFRDTAMQELRAASTDRTLQQLLTLLEARVDIRDRLLPLFSLLGPGAVAAVETLLFRTTNAALREAVFRALVVRRESSARLLERTLAETQSARARSILNLGGVGGIDAPIAWQWIGAACTHEDPTVRADGARNAGRLAGRPGLRLLIDLLGDTDTDVRRAAVQALATPGDASAVPFLARILSDSNDEELELEVLATFRRIATPEVLPPVASVLNRRQFFGGKRLARLKVAALGTASAVATRAARDVLAAAATSKDAEVASEAERLLVEWDRRSGGEK